MKSRWNDADATRAVAERKPDVSELLALRTYSARLLGADPALVLHGGGNTSVKATATTVLGDVVDVIHVKGSGWDLATIEPPGHPAVRMEPLLRLLELPAMTDEQMVNELRLALLDAAAPTPSVETLLHAALPAKFIDHSHADALLAVVDQDDARARCEALFGDGLLFIPYVMPGFGLARACKEAWERAKKEHRDPTVMVLERHGIFTFGETAKESYERMIAAVAKCEAATPKATAEPTRDASVLAALRGAFTRASGESWILALRSSPQILGFLAGDLSVTQRGCATPDHVIRTKPWPMILGSDPDASLREFAARYDAYFESATSKKGARKKLDPWPRIVLVPGLGIVAIGKTKKDAEIAADVYEHTIDVIQCAESIGTYAPVSLDDLFDVEYWSLEQAKIKKEIELPLARRVAVVTGAASGIGRATADLFVELGAHVVVCDRDADALAKIKAQPKLTTVAGDITRAEDVARIFEHAVQTFGGVDIVVSNAGVAAEGALETREGGERLRASLDVNLLSHVTVVEQAVTVFRRQRTGGCLLFNASKSAFNQGPGFGPYAVAKAALVSLMRQYAVDLAKDGIRANAINADRVRTNIFAGGMVESRAAKRGITVDEYFRSNLLGREVTARDVAEGFAYLAQAQATTGAVVTVDGGNAAAFPR